TAFGISLWIKPNFTQASADIERVMDKATATDTPIRLLFLASIDDWRFQITTDVGTKNCDTAGLTWDADTWHHIVVTFDRDANLNQYFDGNLNGVRDISSFDGDNISSSGIIFIGRTAQGKFNGSIDEVMIFNRTLNLSEIQALYDNSQYRLENNFTSLSDGTYDYSAYAIDSAGNLNITTDRQVTVDATFPLISYIAGTESDNAVKNQSNVYINISLTEANLDSVDYYLYNESLNTTGLVGYWSFDDGTAID
ncbi:MAG: LamG domain-containing protein, partial [Nanoarchaeota archaeon]|nr:LamG domain-containing protein [Nanoarchaeota archaeon]